MYVLKKQSVADIIIEILSAIALLLIIVVPIVSYSSLSAEIPIRLRRQIDYFHHHDIGYYYIYSNICAAKKTPNV